MAMCSAQQCTFSEGFDVVIDYFCKSCKSMAIRNSMKIFLWDGPHVLQVQLSPTICCGCNFLDCGSDQSCLISNFPERMNIRSPFQGGTCIKHFPVCIFIGTVDCAADRHIRLSSFNQCQFRFDRKVAFDCRRQCKMISLVLNQTKCLIPVVIEMKIFLSSFEGCNVIVGKGQMLPRKLDQLLAATNPLRRTKHCVTCRHLITVHHPARVTS